MQHPDEGTIHAWLDGALPPAEASALETHVASCAACSARVAEARGMLAAASRILSALDDVPGGVIPAGAPADATRVAPGRSDATEVRPFRFRAARWQVAAGLLIAVSGSWLVMRKADERGMIGIRTADMSVAEQASVPFAPDTLAAGPAVAEAAPQPAPAARAGTSAPERVAARVAGPRAPGAGPSRAAEAPVSPRGIEVTGGNTSAKSIAGYGQGGAGALAGSLPAPRLDSMLAIDSAVTARQAMRLESSVVAEERALASSAQRARAASPAPAALPQAAADVAVAAESRFAQSGVPNGVPRIAGCYGIDIGRWTGAADSASGALLPARLQLAGEPATEMPGGVRFPALPVPGDAAFASGMRAWWTPLGADQLRVRLEAGNRLAVMTLAVSPGALRGRVRVTASDGSMPVAELIARRVACPALPER